MLGTVIASVVRTCCRFSWFVVIGAAILTAGAGQYVRQNFAITTDISGLISAKLPWRQREIQYDAAFPQQTDTITVVVDASTPELVDGASRALADALAKDAKHFQSVRQPDAGPFFEREGLLFLSAPDVARTTEQMIRAQPFLAALAADPSLRGIAHALSFVPNGVKAGRIEFAGLVKPLAKIAEALEALLADRSTAFSWTQLVTGEEPTARELRRFLQVKPVLNYSALEPGGAATDVIRAIVQSLRLIPEHGVSVRLTGPVPLADEEFATVADGAALNGALTVGAVILILWLALRSGRITLAVMLCLLVGLIITAATGLAMVGVLNLISIAFAVLFVGIGVDFGIQYSVRYRQERYTHSDLGAALNAAGTEVGTPLALAAAATAFGFYAFVPTDYRGVSELGLIAGTGMLIAFLTSVTLLPALLTILKPPGEAREVGYRALIPVDLFLARHRRAILLLTGLAVASGLPLLQYVRFDFNPLNLRSSKVESVATMLELMKDPATSPDTIDILTPSLADAIALARRLEQLPEVVRATSLKSFIPEDQHEKLATIADAASLLGSVLEPIEMNPPPTDAETVQSLKDASDAFVEARGNGPWAAVSLRLASALMSLATAAPSRRTSAEHALIVPFNTQLDRIRSALRAEPISIGALPHDLVRDWLAPDGRARVEVTPKGDVTNRVAMDGFVAAVLSMAPNATGNPVLIRESANAVVRAFLEAGGLAILSITLILSVVLRRMSDVLVTLVPLLLAGVVTMELMVLVGLPLNFANIIALPLLLGIGVAFKIYYVLAWRGGETHLLASPLTRAVIFSAMTTATAFGSLWFSNHPGTSSMGKLLSLSLLTTLAAAVLFQPILMGPPRQTRQ
jgi:uncharacterized protein